MDNNKLIKQIVKAAQKDSTFMYKVDKAILDSKIISRREAKGIAKHILKIINVNAGNLKDDIILNTVISFKDHICIRIGQCYMFRPLEEFNSSILSEFSYICDRITKEDFDNFKKYVEYNYRGFSIMDIFEEKEKILKRINICS